MTIGAAVATLVIVALIILGPMATVCSSSGDGFFSCIHDRLATNGLLPKPFGTQSQVAVTAQAGTPPAGSAMVTSSAPPAGTEAASAATPAPVQTQASAPSAPAATPAQPAAVPATSAVASAPTNSPPASAVTETAPAPKTAGTPPASSSAANDATFGLVRAEPDGSLVIAGSAKPGDMVEVYADDKLLGEAKTEQSGDWVLVPDQPVATGGVELTLGVKGAQGRAPQSYVVAIDPGKKSEPLVVASAPGKMDTVLQGLAKPRQELAAASAPAETAAAPQPQEVASATPSAAPPGPAQPAAASAAAPSAPTPAASSMAATSAPPAVTAPAINPAPAPAAKSPPAPAVAEIAPDIDAIEIDGDKNFFAGNGPNRATVRLYVNDKFVADATVAGGRWLIQTGKVLVLHSQTVRIDVLKAGSSAVTSRAEVNFVIDLPQTATATPPTVVAGKPPTPATPAAQPETKPLAVPAKAAAPSAVPENTTIASTAPTVPAPQEVAKPSAAGPAVSQPSSTTDTSPSVASTPAAGNAPEAKPVAPVASPSASAGPNPMAVAGAQPPASTPAATAPASETPATMPTLVAEPVGGANSGRFASGRAIIRHGDNLWTIAQRVYGSGVRYTTIFQANANQIRNPHWIYPGQVFDLPIGGGK